MQEEAFKQNQKQAQRERRYLSEEIEYRAEGGRGRIRGYAAVFNSFSEDLGGFREIIRPGAFKNAISSGQDTRGLFNHDPNIVLGRTTAGTLRLSEDKRGLRYEIDVPDTQQARDLVTLLKRGDVSGSSFSFTIAPGGEAWRTEGEQMIREITNIGTLYDVSAVTFPAYGATVSEAARRSLEELRQSPEKEKKTTPLLDYYRAEIEKRKKGYKQNAKPQ